MSQAQRIDLPSGGWWEIDVNPAWGKLTSLFRGEQATNDSAILVKLTLAWSFPEDITLEAIESRDTADVIPVIEEVFDKILPLFERLGTIRNKASTKPSGTETS